MFLEVAEDNLAARALYDGAGFAVAGRRRDYYGHADGSRSDALVLRLDLNSGRP
jgi:ribosomal-protein-alanine N-acetyltransferase